MKPPVTSLETAIEAAAAIEPGQAWLCLFRSTIDPSRNVLAVAHPGEICVWPGRGPVARRSDVGRIESLPRVLKKTLRQIGESQALSRPAVAKCLPIAATLGNVFALSLGVGPVGEVEYSEIGGANR